ncbi:MAG: hypothetical protein KIS73_26465 [Enhydrobacter sp.]|nr:hypothetical protein [Enhydrobacter sp.]
MGGFGAIYFASRLPRCRAALAFGPQFSVHPEIAPQERRWSDYREAITEWSILHALAGADAGIRPIAFFGSGKDLYQARLFHGHGFEGLTIIRIPACQHDTAAYLRDNGCLPALIELVWNRPGAAEVERLLAAGGIAAEEMVPTAQ